MTTKSAFLALMRERKAFPAGSGDHEYRTRAARKLVWIMRGIPVAEWVQ